MADLPASTSPAAALHPLVQGRCPACNGSSLFLGSGGYVTCSRLDCPNPTAADDLLHRGNPRSVAAATQATDGCCGAEPPRTVPGPDRREWTPGDCWCTLPAGHTGEHRCQPCTDRHGAPGWKDDA